MRNLLVITWAALFFVPASALSATIYVPDDHATIQEAIDASVNGDEVIVRSGTYYENINFMGKAIVVRSEWGSKGCTIDGAQSRVVTFTNGEGEDSVLRGFTITNGYAKHGGGICCNDHSSPTILDNRVSGNAAWEDGGGICCKVFSSPTIANNVVAGNTAAVDGGGISCTDNSAPTISQNTISGNMIDQFGQGGGIFCSGSSSPDIANNRISGNTAYSGGGIYCLFSSSPIIVNNTIIGNLATSAGGGILCTVDSQPTINNNTVAQNAADSGGGFYCFSTSSVIANTILWNNSAAVGPEIWVGESSNPATLTISYSDVQGGQSSVHVDTGCTLDWGAGMIDANPLFADPANGDYHLTYLSPCGNAGDAGSPGLPTEDFEGDPRVAWNGVDMGADEVYFHLYHMGDATPGGSIVFRITGWPDMATNLLLGTGLREPSLPTMYGDFYLEAPITFIHLGPIPPTGIIDYPATIPLWWHAGETYPFQALVGGFGWPSSRLSNLLALTVE